jgi:hypothetical protein
LESAEVVAGAAPSERWQVPQRNQAPWWARETGEYTIVLTPPGAEPKLELLPPVERPSVEPLGVRSRLAESPRAKQSRGEAKRRLGNHPGRDTVHEAHLRAIGFWYLLSAGLGFLCCLGSLTVLASAGARFTALVLPLVAVTAVCGVAGLGLWRRRSWGRWVPAGLAVLSLLGGCLQLTAGIAGVLGVLTGLGWPVAVLWVLFGARGAEVFSPGYQRLLDRDPTGVDFTNSPFFYVPAVLMGLAILLGLVGLAVVAVLAAAA